MTTNSQKTKQLESAGREMCNWNVRVPDELRTWFRGYAREQGISINAAVTVALEAYRAQVEDEE